MPRKSTSNNEVKEVNGPARKITKKNYVNKGSTSESLLVDTGNLPIKSAFKRGAPLNDIPDGRDFDSELAKLVEEFDSDINKRLKAKRKRLEQFKEEAIRLTSEKIFHMDEKQSVERKSLWNDFRNKMGRLLDLEEAALMEMKEARTMQDKRHILPAITSQRAQRTQIMKNMADNFLDEMDELESRHVEQFAKASEDK